MRFFYITITIGLLLSVINLGLTLVNFEFSKTPEKTELASLMERHDRHISICKDLCEQGSMWWVGVRLHTLDTKNFLDSNNLEVNCICGGSK